MYSRDFETRYSDIEKHWERLHRLSMMEIISIIISIFGIIVVLVLLCRCCRRNKQGQIISPPPPAPPGPLNTAPYPQQQFVTAYPVSSPYPSYGVQMPMPAGVVSPAGAVMAPYPVHPPHPMPQPSIAPTAPDLTAFYGPPAPDWNAQATLPPSYEQATGANMKQSPYNPSFQHS